MDLLHISESRLKGILKRLNWIEECNSHTNHFGLPLQKCTFDENHWIPSDRTHEHEEFCKLRKCGYTKNEIFNMLPTPAIAGMGELRRHRTSEPMVSLDSLDLDAFSTSQQKKMRMVQYRLPEDGHRVETLALIRDSKRRSKSYRGIHTARRSYTEILREIIEQQTELLQEAYKRQYRSNRKQTKAVEDSAPSERDYRPRLGRSGERQEIPVTPTQDSFYERRSDRFSLNAEQPKSTPRSPGTSSWHKRHRHHKKHRHRSPS